jgi:hypothetical protein
VDPHQKAAGFNSFIKTVREAVPPADFERLVGSLAPESAELITRPRFSTSWIPLALTNPVVIAVGEHLLGGSPERIFEIGREQFIADIGGVYKIFIRIASPAYVAERASKIYETYNQNSGKMRVISSTEKSLEVVVEDYPKPSPTVWHYVRGCIAGTLELTGAKQLRVVIAEGGEAHPRCLYRVTWS